MNSKALIFSILLCVMIPAQVEARDTEPLTQMEEVRANQAIRSLQQGDYKTALKILEGFARAGKPSYQYLVGLIYMKENSTATNLPKAKYWLEKSARQGYIDAQMELVGLYLNGHGDTFKQDYRKALYWTEQAAKQGHVGSQQTLAIMYLDGTGVPVDLAKFLYWTERAAENGDRVAQYNLGVMHMNSAPELISLNVPMNIPKAIALINKSAVQGYAKAQFYLGKIYQYGLYHPVDKEKARFWYQRAAEQGHEEAAEYLRNL